MVFERIWSGWPFRGYFGGGKNLRRHVKQGSRSGSSVRGQTEPFIQYLGPWESKIIALQSILIWEKPGKSIMAICTANLFFWILASSDVRFFFGVSVVGLAAFLHHEWVYSIWPEIRVPMHHSDHEDWTPVHPSVLSAPEVSRYLEDTWKYILEQQIRLSQLRKKQPGWFCVAVVTAFSFLFVLGRFVPGIILLYALLMGVMCGPGAAIHMVSPATYKRLRELRVALFGRRNDGGSPQSPENDLADFLPEESSAEVQSALGIPLSFQEPRGGEFSDEDGDTMAEGRRGRRSSRKQTGTQRRKGDARTSKKKVSLDGSSFTAGLLQSDFPTVEDTLESLDTLDETDLLPPEISPRPGGVPIRDLVAVSDGGPTGTESMTFVSSHFGDSSDDEDDFSTGLTFRTTPVAPTPGADEGNFPPPPAFLPYPIAPSAAAVTSFVGNWVASENPAAAMTLLGSIGHQLVSALGAAGQPGTGSSAQYGRPVSEAQDRSATPHYEESDQEMTNSGSSLDEDFELISDDDLH